MKILALQGSPRTEGNTQAVLEIVLAATAQAGADTEIIQLARLDKLTGCRECFACQQKTDEPGCAIDDDMQDIYEKMLKADAVVWATPVFCWSPSWLIKMAMDRFYCMFKFGGDEDYKCLLQGRRMAAVISAGGGDEDGADLVTETCKRLANLSQGIWLGSFIASRVESPDTIRADTVLVERARAFGRNLAE